MRATIPANEPARIAALRRYSILDTGAEDCYDRVTRMAALLFRVRIAQLSLVDVERQWFKSCQGLDARETHRDLSFCAHAILVDEPLIVLDAKADPRFSDNSLVNRAPLYPILCGRHTQYARWLSAWHHLRHRYRA